MDFTGPRLSPNQAFPSLVPLGLENLLFQAHFASKCQVWMSPHCKWLPVAWFLSSSSPSLPLHTDRRCRCLKKQYTRGALLPGTELRHETTLPRQELTTTDLIFPLGIIEKLHVTDVSHFTGCRAGRCSDIHWRRVRKGSDGAITLCDAELLLVSSGGALQRKAVSGALF